MDGINRMLSGMYTICCGNQGEIDVSSVSPSSEQKERDGVGARVDYRVGMSRRWVPQSGVTPVAVRTSYFDSESQGSGVKSHGDWEKSENNRETSKKQKKEGYIITRMTL